MNKNSISSLKFLKETVKDIDWICVISGSQIFQMGEPRGLRPIMNILDTLQSELFDSETLSKGFLAGNQEKYIFFSYQKVHLVIKGSMNLSIGVVESLVDIPSILRNASLGVVDKDLAMVPQEFWSEVEKAVALKIGPVAKILIDDTLKSMSRTKDTISINELPRFIEILGEEINNQELKEILIDIFNKVLTSI